MAAFSFVERLSGSFYRLDDPLVERSIRLDIEAHVRNVRQPLASVTGRIHAEGLADAPVQGTIGLQALGDRRIPYDVAFVGEDGRTYRLRGEKDLSWLAPVETLVVLPFTIATESDGAEAAWLEVARGTMRFDVGRESLRALVRSLRAAPF
jgi:hypothetical protein